MALLKHRLQENSPGPFFVDSNCINCGSCWHIDPEHFAPAGNNAYVYLQPNSQREIERAFVAMIDCPVAAIGAPKELTKNLSPNVFPILITNHPVGHVYYCGWSSKEEFWCK